MLGFKMPIAIRLDILRIDMNIIIIVHIHREIRELHGLGTYDTRKKRHRKEGKKDRVRIFQVAKKVDSVDT